MFPSLGGEGGDTRPSKLAPTLGHSKKKKKKQKDSKYKFKSTTSKHQQHQRKGNDQTPEKAKQKSFSKPRVNFTHNAFQFSSNNSNSNNNNNNNNSNHNNSNHSKKNGNSKASNRRTDMPNNMPPLQAFPTLNMGQKAYKPYLSKSKKSHKKLKNHSRLESKFGGKAIKSSFSSPVLRSQSEKVRQHNAALLSTKSGPMRKQLNQVQKQQQQQSSYAKNKKQQKGSPSLQKSLSVSASLPSLAGKKKRKTRKPQGKVTPIAEVLKPQSEYMTLDLERRLIEIHSLLRLDFSAKRSFHECVSAINRSLAFLRTLELVSTQHSANIGTVFQDLLFMLTSEGIGMTGHIMRTARTEGGKVQQIKKVRGKNSKKHVAQRRSVFAQSALSQGNSILPQLKPMQLSTLMNNSHVLRKLVRIKLEDQNDLKLAEKALSESMQVLEDVLKAHNVYLSKTTQLMKLSIEEFIKNVL